MYFSTLQKCSNIKNLIFTLFKFEEVLFTFLEVTYKLIFVSNKVALFNGTVHLKNVNNYLNTNIYSCLETSGGQSSDLYFNVVHFFNTIVN
jgi:hypothetical protein